MQFSLSVVADSNTTSDEVSRHAAHPYLSLMAMSYMYEQNENKSDLQ
jgi:hypothetical protein